MRKASSPHYLCTGIIVSWIILQYPCHLHDSLNNRSCNGIGDFHCITLSEPTLHRMHDDIRTSAGSLIIWQCHGKLWVHDSKDRSGKIAVCSHLQPSILIGDNRRTAHLASCRCKSQNNAYRETSLGNTLLGIEIPHISGIRRTITDSLGRINHTASANSQNQVDFFLSGNLNALSDKRKPWIRHYSAKFSMLDSSCIQL